LTFAFVLHRVRGACGRKKSLPEKLGLTRIFHRFFMGAGNWCSMVLLRFIMTPVKFGKFFIDSFLVGFPAF
jgi:hypothetical protein